MKEERLSSGARLYVGAVIGLGAVALLHSMYVLQKNPVSYHWSILAGLTLLTGSFTVRIPTIPARLSVSEVFVFAAVLLFGPAAATMIVVLDTLVISLWQKRRSRRPSRVLFNVAAPSVAIWVAAHGFFAVAHIRPLASHPQPILPLLVPILLLTVLYFLLNSVLVAWAVAFEKGVSAFSVWSESFLWLSLNYFSGASVAALLLPYLQPEQPQFARVIGILLPLLLISYLTFKTAMGRVDDAHRHLKELNHLYLSTIETLAMAIDAKDQITHGHIRRVQVHAVKLAKAMGVKDSSQIRAIEAAALLHDMGKLAVPEYILNKPGPLTAAEFDKMKLHASVGADILSAIDFPYPVVPIVRHHHENWDGSGYPDGLGGAGIPIGARILSVVDCFDALTSDRPYRPRLSDKEALRILFERRGHMYDPLVVDTFSRLHSQGGLLTPELSDDSSFATFRNTSLPADSTSSDIRPLEDITASGEEMLVLLELAQQLGEATNITHVGDVVVRHLRRVVPWSLLVLYLHDQDSTELLSTYEAGEHSSVFSGLRIPLGQRLSGWVGAHKQSIRNSDPVLDLGDVARAVTPRLRSCLSTPLVVGQSLVGVLSLYSSTQEAFTTDHQRVIEVFAKQIATALQNINQKGRHSELGEPEPNQNSARDSVKQLRDLRIAFSVIVITISGGRSEPDINVDVIEETLARCVRNNLGATDIFFRYQLNQYVIVQRRTDRSDPDRLTRRIEQAIEELRRELRAEETFSASVVLARMPEDGGSLQDLVVAARRRADLEISNGTKRLAEPPGSIH
jgi:putative nucleotidyltransferase with HDIG domain